MDFFKVLITINGDYEDQEFTVDLISIVGRFDIVDYGGENDSDRLYSAIYDDLLPEMNSKRKLNEGLVIESVFKRTIQWNGSVQDILFECIQSEFY
jgi:hypothetical protein